MDIMIQWIVGVWCCSTIAGSSTSYFIQRCTTAVPPADQRRAQQDADDGLPGLHRQQPDDGRRNQRDERRHLDLTADQHNQRASRRQRKPGTGIRRVLYAERQIQRPLR